MALGEQPAEHAGGVRGQRQRAGEGAQAGGDQQQRGPDQLGDGAQRVQQQPRRRARAGRIAIVQPAGRQRQQQARSSGQRGAQRRHRQRLPGAQQHLAQEGGRGVGREELAEEAPHAAQRLERQELPPLQVQRPEAGHHQQQHRRHEPAGLAARVEQRRRQPVGLVGRGHTLPIHASALRSCALTRSASATSATNTASMVSTSPPSNIFIELSICWPSPPAPTKPSTTELRIAHSQR